MKSDAQLQLDVIAELKWEPALDAASIGVEVKDGIVTLAGHVSSYSEKWNAETAAQRVAGVRALAVEIDVQLPGNYHRTDADIARSAENVLQWMSMLHKDKVKVMVEAGWITLGGEVSWEYQRRAAEKSVRGLLGVKGVSNQIMVKPHLTSGTIKSDIEAALKRRATDESQHISVSVEGTEVTLSGTANSLSESILASQAAWRSPGVWNVVNDISISI